MKQKILFRTLMILFVISSHLVYGQKGEAVLILKDSTKIKGTGEISGISSVVSIKFGNDTLKYRTYKPKEAIGIDILEKNYYRKFRYKYIDDKKFPEVLEIVSIDSLSLYVRIYEQRILSNSYSPEPVIIIGKEYVQNIKLDNGKEISVGFSRNVYYNINFPRYSYYVGQGASNHVEHLYTKGLPLAKGFKKSIKTYFKDCPELVKKVENKEFSNSEVWKVLDFYNLNCFKAKNN
ncbi:hypothetical protein [Sinomicrobium sp. M5D2P17]